MAISDEEVRLLHILHAAAANLAEHFGTVQIFVTNHDGAANKTLRFHAGEGDWYARYGAVAKWVNDENGRPDDEGMGDEEDEEAGEES